MAGLPGRAVAGEILPCELAADLGHGGWWAAGFADEPVGQQVAVITGERLVEGVGTVGPDLVGIAETCRSGDTHRAWRELLAAFAAGYGGARARCFLAWANKAVPGAQVSVMGGTNLSAGS